MFRKNVASQFIHFQGVDSTTGGIKSGVTWTIRRCIDGTFAAATGTVTEDGTTGWYKLAMSQADTNGNDIGFNFTGSGAVPQTVNIVTTAADPTDGVRLGLTALPNAAAEAAGGLYTRGTGAGQIKQTNNGEIDSNATHMNNVATTPITTIKAVQGLAVDGVITTLTNLPAITAGWLTATGIAAAALNGKGDWLLSSGYTAPDNTSIAMIKVQTDKLVFTAPGYVDVNVLKQNGVTMYGAGATGNLWRGTP